MKASKKCPKCKDWRPGRILVGRHTLTEEALYERIVNRMTKREFHTFVKKIEKDLDKEHA